ncbi:YbaB/EbfC family nucleoid-associated protein [Nonomuraea endophytica]|uniref:YbaB/EbfC family nucleoid-associated protein n=1 Tax=Nonomuraea endophytica TaxID=714136 RepID=UPI0037C9AE2E
MDSSNDRDAAGLQAYADELRTTFMRLQSEGTELHAKARALQVTEKSRDGLVNATVGSRGELIRLDLDPRIYRHPDARTLADTITETVQRAGEKVREQLLELFSPLIPAEQMQAHLDGDLETVMAQLADQMGGRR